MIGPTAAAVEHGSQISGHQKQIEHHIYHVVLPLLGQEQQHDAQHTGGQDLPEAEFAAQQPGPIGHIQQNKAEEETESVGDLVGEVEAVPDIIQLAENEAGDKQQQKCQTAQLVPQIDLAGQQEQQGKRNGKDTAVQIRQTVDEGGGDGGTHIAGYLSHAVEHHGEGGGNGGEEQTHQTTAALCFGGLEGIPGFLGGGNFFTGDHVHGETIGEVVDAGLGIPQGGQGGQGQKCGQTDGQNGEETNAGQIFQETQNAFAPAQFVGKEQEEGKDTYKQADIVVGCNGKEEGNGVKDELAVLDQRYRAQCHQGQQSERIQPHDIPVVAQRPGTQTVEGTEHHDRRIVFLENALEHDGKEHTGQADFNGQQQGEILQHPAFRQNCGDQIQRGSQIIGHQTQIVHAHTHAPVIKQGITGAQCLPEFHKERVVLVVHITVEHTALAKWLTGSDEHKNEHQRCGQKKCQGRIVPTKTFHFR